MPFLVWFAVACTADPPPPPPLPPPPVPEAAVLADVVAVDVAGAHGSYSFSVTVRSPDTGCDRYADWWEVLSPQGDLLYRRTLAHSHVGEQPFVRGGGPVALALDDEVVVRAHLHPDGYGGQAMRGSVRTGFAVAALPSGFATDLASAPPLPESCLR